MFNAPTSPWLPHSQALSPRRRLQGGGESPVCWEMSGLSTDTGECVCMCVKEEEASAWTTFRWVSWTPLFHSGPPAFRAPDTLTHPVPDSSQEDF